MSRRALVGGLAASGFAALAGSGLAGCTSVPTNGLVEQVSPRVEQSTDTSVRIDAEGPRPGAAPALVVEGFLNAIASLEPGFATARLYLTDAARESWDPAAGTTITSGLPLTATAASQVLVAPLQGQLDADGHHTPRQGTLRHDFGLQKVAGQWRIGNPPAGLLVSMATFSSYYTSMTRWFLSGDDRMMVPETLRVPQSRCTPTAAVTALLHGASDWLGDAVDTAIPAGTQLAGPAVVVAGDGTAEVDLTGQAIALSDDQRTGLALQVAWTLQQFPALSRVRVLSGGQPLGTRAFGTAPIELGGVLPRSPVEAPATATPMVVQSGRLGTLASDASNTSFAPASGSLQRSGVVGRPEFALLDATTLAWSDATGALVTDGGPTTRVLRERTWGTPQALPDDTDAFWVGVLRGGHPGLARVPRRGSARVIALTGLPAGTPRAFRVSPDGSRIAVVVQRGAQSTLGLLALDSDGGRTTGWTPLVLGGTGSATGTMTQLVWVGTGRLAVLGAVRSDGTGTVFQVSDDGAQVLPLGPVVATGVTRLAGVPTTDPGLQLFAVTSHDTLLRCEDPWRWTVIAHDVTAAAVQD